MNEQCLASANGGGGRRGCLCTLNPYRQQGSFGDGGTTTPAPTPFNLQQQPNMATLSGLDGVTKNRFQMISALSLHTVIAEPGLIMAYAYSSLTGKVLSRAQARTSIMVTLHKAFPGTYMDLYFNLHASLPI